MKVYLLIIDSTMDYDTQREVKVFANRTDAEKEFNEEVKAAIIDAPVEWEIEDSNTSFSIYEDGYYARNHIDVDILEKDVILKDGLIEFVALSIIEMYHKELNLTEQEKNDVAALVERVLLKTEEDIDIFYITDFIAINLKKVYNLSTWEIISKYYEMRESL